MNTRFLGRTCRGFHWLPRTYPGIPEHQRRSAGLGLPPTSLVCWLWWSWEVEP